MLDQERPRLMVRPLLELRSLLFASLHGCYSPWPVPFFMNCLQLPVDLSCPWEYLHLYAHEYSWFLLPFPVRACPR